MQFDVVELLKLVASILSGIAVCIPLVQKLISVTKAYAKSKNWQPIMKLVMDCMAEAEVLYEDGAARKAYVMSAIRKSATYVNYDIDMAVISQMIDDLCEMSKVVNFPAKPAETAGGEQ